MTREYTVEFRDRERRRSNKIRWLSERRIAENERRSGFDQRARIAPAHPPVTKGATWAST